MRRDPESAWVEFRPERRGAFRTGLMRRVVLVPDRAEDAETEHGRKTADPEDHDGPEGPMRDGNVNSIHGASPRMRQHLPGSNSSFLGQEWAECVNENLR